MKSWLKGGLIGAGIFLISMAFFFLCYKAFHVNLMEESVFDEKCYYLGILSIPFFLISLLGSSLGIPSLFHMPSGALFSFVLAFLIGALIGLTVGKKKSKEIIK